MKQANVLLRMIQNFLDDPSNNCMWIGTVAYGLVRYDRGSGKCKVYQYSGNVRIQGINVIKN